MTTLYWISGTAGDWSDASDWQSGVTPTSADGAVVNRSDSVTVNGTAAAYSLGLNSSNITISGSLSLGTSLTVDGGSEVFVSGGTLSAQSIVTDNSGYILGHGTISGDVIGDGFIIDPQGGTLEFKGALAGSIVYGSPYTPSTVILDQPTEFTGSLNYISVGDTLDLDGITASSATFNGSTLTINETNGQHLAYTVSNASVAGDVLNVVSVQGMTQVRFVAAALQAMGTTISGTEGAAISGATVATFTDADPNATASDFTATINWGDGTTSAGTVVAQNGGGFAVNGGHTYTDEGQYQIGVTVNDIGGSTGSATSTASIADAALSATGTTISSTEGTAISGATVATFTDANPNAAASDFTATINWGDGTSTTGTVVAQNGGGFAVNGGHTYANEGTYTVGVTINDVGGSTASATSSASITGATLFGNVTNFAIEPIGAHGEINFTEPPPATGSIGPATSVSYNFVELEIPALSTIEVVIYDQHGLQYLDSYGNDGGHQIPLGDGSFTVGSTMSASGPYAGKSINGIDLALFAAQNNVGYSTVLSPSLMPIGVIIPGLLQSSTHLSANLERGVATFTNDQAGGPAVVEIDWVGTLGSMTASFSVSSASIADAALSATGGTISSTEGTAISGATVATFTDANPNAAASDFTATINWGDGTSATGTVVAQNGGGFAVNGGHTYTDEGQYQIGVTVDDIGGSTGSATSTASIADAALSATGTTITSTEGTAISGATVATFTDANPNAAASDFTATINWGDGTSTTGTVVAQNGGGFAVNGGHTYADEGTYTVGVTINDVGGSTTSATSNANIDDAALTGSGTTVSGTEGTAISGATVATFTDANPNAAASDFTATINWGDGTHTTGTVVAESEGGFAVEGSHNYANDGKYTLGIKIDDIGGSSAVAISSASVGGPQVELMIDPVDVKNVINHAEARAVGGISITGKEIGLSSGATFVVSMTDGSFSKDYTATVKENGLWRVAIPSADAVTLPNGTATVTAQADSVQVSEKVTVDETFPTVLSIVASPSKGDLDAGKVVTLTVDFSKKVTVTGHPVLKLNDGGLARYVAGSGTTALRFDYTVAAGQNTPDLTVTGLVLPSGVTIKDAAGNNAVLSGAVRNPPGILQIDTTAPEVKRVVTSPTSGEVITGQEVRITLDMNERVSVAGSPTLLLNDGGTARYDAAHSTGTALAFDYTVTARQVTTDLAVSGIELPTGSSIRDLAGNNAPLSGAGVNLGLEVNTKPLAITNSTDFQLRGPSNANVAFGAGSRGTLTLDDSQAYAGTVDGLAPGNHIDLADISFSAHTTLGYMPNNSNSGGVLTASDGSHVAKIALLGQYAAASFVMASDGHGGTLISDPPELIAQTQLTKPHG
jgi:hypothetical protein